MIGDVIEKATKKFEDSIVIGGKSIKSRTMGSGEKVGKKKPDAMNSVLVSVTGWRDAKDTQFGGRSYEVRFVAFCGSKNKVGDYTRLLVSALMAEQVTKLLENETWGLTNVGAAKFEASTDRTRLIDANSGLAIWEVSWWQEIPLTRGDIAPTLYRLQEVQGETDLHGSLDDSLEMQSSTMPAHGNLNPPPAPEN